MAKHYYIEHRELYIINKKIPGDDEKVPSAYKCSQSTNISRFSVVEKINMEFLDSVCNYHIIKMVYHLMLF